MKYIKYTYVDAVTGIPVSAEPAANGPAQPAVIGLAFAWARESRYPTDVPEFFGTCPDDSDTDAPGVLGVFLQSDWEQMRSDEMAARNSAPAHCSRRQGRLALLQTGRLDAAEAAISAIEDPSQRRAAQIEYEADTWERGNPFLQALWAALGGTNAELDDLFGLAVTL